MKLTSLFHLSLITLAVGLTADLAAAATVQPNAQSSASAQAEAKEARADHKAPESKPQQPLTFKFQAVEADGSAYSPSAGGAYITKLTLNKKENFSILANLLKTDTANLQKLATQPNPIPVPKNVYDAIKIVSITEKEQTAEKAEDNICLPAFSAAMTWYAAYMQAVANEEIVLGEHANLNGAVGACVHVIINLNLIREDRAPKDLSSYLTPQYFTPLIQTDNIIKFLLQNSQLTTIKITLDNETCDAAQYMFMMTNNPNIFCHDYASLKVLQCYFSNDSYNRTISDQKLFYAYLSLLPKKSLLKMLANDNTTFERLTAKTAREEAIKLIENYKENWEKEKKSRDEQRKSAAAATEQQPKVAPAPVAAESDHPQANPAPIMDAPVQPKNIFTRTKDFFGAHRLARYGAYAFLGAAAIYGGYRLYKHANMRKLARYAGNWA